MKVGKRNKRILIVLGLLVVGWLSINWFFNYRLESYLNQRLSSSISRATDGFYELSFNNLSLGFFNGELSLDNVELKPNQQVFDDWELKDSLPHTYYHVKIDNIDLKGINLTWRFNYKRLKFEEFELIRPYVKIFDTQTHNEINFSTKEKKEFKDIYQLISPYFNVISAKTIRLKEADVVYEIKDVIYPTVYGLKSINFDAFNFVLDEYSQTRGNLLFCENFNFSVEHPQKIMENNQLTLNADTIRLSTFDSIVQIKGVRLEPQHELWSRLQQTPDDYMTAFLKNVELNGIQFDQVGGFKHLIARRFLVDSSNINYFSKYNVEEQKIETLSDSVVQSLSLYKTIAPFFASVSIDNIDLKRTKLEYTHRKDGFDDIYTLNDLHLSSESFYIDSLIERRPNHTFWYSKNFVMDAKNISGTLYRKNHLMNIGHLRLDIPNKYLRVEDIEVKPISKKTQKDYIEGQIKHLVLEELSIQKGVEAETLEINNTKIVYAISPQQKLKSKKKPTAHEFREKSNVIDIVAPFLDHLAIKRIRINNANLGIKTNSGHYELNNVYTTTSNFLINTHTRHHSPYHFSYGDFSLSFRNFNNYTPAKSHLVQITKGYYLQSKGRIKLENIKITPQKKDLSATKYLVNLSLLEIDRSVYDTANKSIYINSLIFNDPQITILQKEQKKKDIERKVEEEFDFLKRINIDHILSRNINLKNIKRQDTSKIVLDSLRINNTKIELSKSLDISLIDIQKPSVNLASGSKITSNRIRISDIQAQRHDKFSIRNFDFDGFNLSLDQNNLVFALDTDLLGFDDLNWNNNFSVFNLKNIYINQPYIHYHQTKKEPPSPPNSKKKDIYTTLSNIASSFYIGNIHFTKGKADYCSITESNKTINQNLNDIAFNLDGFKIDTKGKKVELEDISFNIKDLNFPIMDSFYRISLQELDFNKQKESLSLNGLSMKSTYPKFEFAYKHPKHKDWFNVEIKKTQLSGIGVDQFLSDSTLHIKDFVVENVLLENFKNQQIEIEHNIMPMIYDEIHKIPFKLYVDNLDVKNFNVTYEELAKKGIKPSRIFFTEMNGHVSDFTNFATRPAQFNQLDANGKIMGTGFFTAQWKMPVSKQFDVFVLSAHLRNFDMTELNQLITPMAPARVDNGFLSDFRFYTEASSTEASAYMQFLYNDLDLTIYRNLDLQTKQSFYTYMANRVLKSNNPDSFNKKPRLANSYLLRDPYHSTFNYFWQILQPPLAESVGVSKGKQNFFRRIANSIGGLKKIFRGGEKKEDEKK